MKIYKTIIAAVATVMLAGCSSFLNVDNPGKNTIDKFFKDVSSLNSAGDGLFLSILKFYDDYTLYAELAGDMLNIQAVGSLADESYSKAHNFEYIPEDNTAAPRTLWIEGYTIVTNANNIIAYAPGLLETSSSYRSTINRIVGYAYFSRALAFFFLCQCYAQPYNYTDNASHIGIPVITRVPGFDDVIARDPVSKVYSQIVSDLNTAYSLLKEMDSPDIYHASSTACEALLARVYLYMENWEQAARYAKNVMDKVPLSPNSQYRDMFRNPSAVPGDESILRVNHYDNLNSMTSASDPAGKYSVLPNPTIETYFDLDDIRKEMLTYVVEDYETWETPGKRIPALTKFLPYKNISQVQLKYAYSFILRCSEMYLIHAEALCRGPQHDLAGAAEDLKALIARGRNIPSSSVSLSYASQSDMETLIERERIKELCFEGHRLFDITRRKQDLVRSAQTSSKVRTITYPDYRFVLPICQLEMQANEHMKQNEGYSTNY